MVSCWVCEGEKTVETVSGKTVSCTCCKGTGLTTKEDRAWWERLVARYESGE